MTAPIRTCAIVALIATLSALAGCGQTGPLYLPNKPQRPVAPPGEPLLAPAMAPARAPAAEVPPAASLPAAKSE